MVYVVEIVWNLFMAGVAAALWIFFPDIFTATMPVFSIVFVFFAGAAAQELVLDRK